MKELRVENNLTQLEIAKTLKISRSVYNRYENGQRATPLDVLWSLADFYTVSIDYLVGRED